MKKVTKKQRKAITPPNAMVIRSMQFGDDYGSVYRGEYPSYHDMNPPSAPVTNWVKVKPGIPFVNVTLRRETLSGRMMQADIDALVATKRKGLST